MPANSDAAVPMLASSTSSSSHPVALTPNSSRMRSERPFWVTTARRALISMVRISRKQIGIEVHSRP